jgi:hypothetical protein
MPKIVYSRTLREVGPNATIVRDVVAEEVLALTPGTRRRPVRRWGGTGRVTAVRTPLELAETRPFGNGVVLMRHVRKFPRRPEPGRTP